MAKNYAQNQGHKKTAKKKLGSPVRRAEQNRLEAEGRLVANIAADIRESWFAHRSPRPVFDSPAVPLASATTLGRQPSESEYAAAVVILLTDAGHECAFPDVVHNRDIVEFARHSGIEPEVLAHWVEEQHAARRANGQSGLNRARRAPGRF